jgi:hypothetical protein
MCNKQKKGGSGGKLGHSHMSHWVSNDVIKFNAKKERRLEEKKIIQSELDENTRLPKLKIKRD